MNITYLPPYFVAASVFTLGLIVGSFLNVVIHRVPLEESIVLPSSHCPSCGVDIKPYDNIPVLSYILLRGRCRNCKVGISPIYPAIELLTGCLYLLVYLADGLHARLVTDIVFVSLIIPLVFIDLHHKILPNVITYPGFVLAFLMRFFVPGPSKLDLLRSAVGLQNLPGWAVSALASLVGAVIGAGIIWGIRAAYFRVKGVEGMGLGDVKLMLMVGAYIGWQLSLLTILLGSLGGSIIGVVVIASKRGSMKTQIPFGVFLGPAAIIALFFGPRFIAWYLGMLR
jgi:leader peptidase (prepilin peptidase) / N-methyltransferase